MDRFGKHQDGSDRQVPGNRIGDPRDGQRQRDNLTMSDDASRPKPLPFASIIAIQNEDYTSEQRAAIKAGKITKGQLCLQAYNALPPDARAAYDQYVQERRAREAALKASTRPGDRTIDFNGPHLAEQLRAQGAPGRFVQAAASLDWDRSLNR